MTRDVRYGPESSNRQGAEVLALGSKEPPAHRLSMTPASMSYAHARIALRFFPGLVSSVDAGADQRFDGWSFA
jgi:hypothetical protein